LAAVSVRVDGGGERPTGEGYNRQKKAVGKPVGTTFDQIDPISTADKFAAEKGISDRSAGGRVRRG